MTPQTDLINALNRRLEQVEAERDYWRREAEGENNVARQQKIRRALGLTGREAMLVDALYQARSHRSKEALFNVVCANDDVDINIVPVFISKIRKRIGKDAITNLWGVGFQLSDRGRQLVEDALADEGAA